MSRIKKQASQRQETFPAHASPSPHQYQETPFFPFRFSQKKRLKTRYEIIRAACINLSKQGEDVNR